MSIDIHKVTVLGTGVLGSQIAYQTAFSGFEVTAYDINDDALKAAGERFTKLAAVYKSEVDGAGDGKADRTATSITLTSDLAQAVRDADLVIEAVPEVLAIKQDTYEKLGELAPERTIFATNSSTLLPSAMVEFTGSTGSIPGAALRQSGVEVQYRRSDGHARDRSEGLSGRGRLRRRHRHGAHRIA